MLKGFIDLVFEFQGRFYVVDWKSNLLGNRIEDYSAAALADEIRRRHYYFQYQLYTVALDRYLRLRLPGIPLRAAFRRSLLPVPARHRPGPARIRHSS